MKTQFKIEKLVRSMRLFESKLKKERAFMVNGRLPPVLRKQMESIINQAKKIDVEDL